MKKLVYLVLIFGFIALIIGTILNYKSFVSLPDQDFNKETIQTLDMLREHCFSNICINDLYIEKTTDNYYGEEYSLVFDMENKGKDTLKDINLVFILFNKEDKVTVKGEERLTLEKDELYSYSIDSIKDTKIEKVTDYTFSYTSNN